MAHGNRAPAPANTEQLQLPLLMPPQGGEAARYIHLGSRIVSFRLVRSRRRTIAMSIDQRGLRVGAPNSARIRDIEDFISGNAAWVLRKLDDWQSAGSERRLLVSDGVRLPVLGEDWTVQVAPGCGEVHWNEANRVLTLCPRPDVEPRLLLVGELRRRALDLLQTRAADLIHPLGRPLPRVALSDAQTRWGSCSSRSGLRFNWRLIHLPLRLVDYVVAHELGHLLEMNHSRRFWRVVESLYPDYLVARQDLRVRALTMQLL